MDGLVACMDDFDVNKWNFGNTVFNQKSSPNLIFVAKNDIISDIEF